MLETRIASRLLLLLSRVVPDRYPPSSAATRRKKYLFYIFLESCDKCREYWVNVMVHGDAFAQCRQCRADAIFAKVMLINLLKWWETLSIFLVYAETTRTFQRRILWTWTYSPILVVDIFSRSLALFWHLNAWLTNEIWQNQNHLPSPVDVLRLYARWWRQDRDKGPHSGEIIKNSSSRSYISFFLLPNISPYLRDWTTTPGSTLKTCYAVNAWERGSTEAWEWTTTWWRPTCSIRYTH